MKRTSFWLILIVGLQVAWMAATATVKEIQLKSGTTVLLETAPVDPRDLLSGDYVILSYRISNIPFALFQQSGAAAQDLKSVNRAVYVVLHKNGQFHQAISASLELIVPKSGDVVIKGNIAPNPWRSGDVRINYGLEKYFVPEGTGNPVGKLSVKASVSPQGDAIIKQVFIDGKP
ncbi:MAG: GDYXXLXY domain-containing protein, partial [Limisphaerales bacterium]